MSPTVLVLAFSLAGAGTPDAMVIDLPDGAIYLLDASIDPIDPLDASVPAADASVSSPDASVTPRDAAVVTPDASVWVDDLVARPASLTLSPGAFVGAWTSPLRDEAFGSTRGRGHDLWTNAWATGGGLGTPWGALLCAAASGEHFSEPRVAWVGTHYVFLWRVERAGFPEQQLRLAKVSTSGVVDSCTTVFATASAFLAVQLAASGQQAYVVWETGTQVLGQLVGATSATVLLAKTQTLGTARPSLAGLDFGYRVAWVEGAMLGGALISQGGQVTFEAARNVAARHVAVTGTTTARAVYVRPDAVAAPSLEVLDYAAPQASGQLQPVTTDAPPLAAAAGNQLFAVHFPGNAAGRAEVVQRGLSTTTALGAGLIPRAMAAGELRAGLLAAEAGGWRVFDLPALASSSEPPLNPLSLATPGAWQQEPTAAWAGPDGWAVTWREAGANLASGALVRLDGGLQGFAAVADAGVPRMVTATNGAVLGVSLATAQQTTLYETATAGLSTSAAQVRHSAAGHQAGAALGAHLAALWTPGGASLSWTGSGSVGTWSAAAGGRLGRCGAFLGTRLWVPTTGGLTAGDLSLLALDDTATVSGPQPAVHQLGPSLGATVESSCLAINGTQGLLAWVSSAGQVGLAFVDFAGGAPVLGPPLAVGTSSARARDVVVAAVTGGYAVAWEAGNDRGSEIVALGVSRLGALDQTLPQSAGLDARSPWLAPAPNGQALLSFHQLSAEAGAVLVKTRVLGVAVAVDGGVAADAGFVDAGLVDAGLVDAGFVDAGLVDAGQEDAGVDDAGVSDGGTGEDAGTGAGEDAGTGDAGSEDGGLTRADGGAAGGGDLNEPVAFTSCGCSADGASALVALALLALRRRVGRAEERRPRRGRREG